MQKSIIVTGASGHLGKVVVHHLAEAGFHILATVYSEKSKTEMQSDQVESSALDLSKPAEVKRFVEQVKRKRDIAAAVCLAGGFGMGDLKNTDQQDLHKMIALNFETAFYLVQQLLPVFEERGGGQIIFIGSRPALEPEAGKKMVSYALSKGLIFQLAEMVNAYGEDKGIDATVLVPSVIDTPANRKAMSDADYSKWVSREAIAETISFVLSNTGKQMRQSILKLYNEA